MFVTIDMNLFAIELKKIRVSSGYTQKKVSDVTGINIDSLRKIENALVIPKFETLEILSNCYKVNLLLVLEQCKYHKEIQSLYERLDKIILEPSILNFSIFNDFIDQFEHQNELTILVEREQILKFKAICKVLSFDFSLAEKEATKSIDILENALLLSKPDFDLSTFNNSRYNLIEGRLLLLLALEYVELQEFALSNRILLFLLANSTLIEISTHTFNLKQKIFTNISYNFHRINNHWNALLFAEKGLSLARQNHSTYCVPLLLARKSIAMFFLEQPHYDYYMHQAIYILDLSGHTDLKNTYIEIAKTKYNIKFND